MAKTGVLMDSLYKQIFCIIATLCLLNGAPVYADQVLLIGGGSNVNSSSAQLEESTKWIQKVLVQTPLSVSTYYTDADAPSLDVHYAASGKDINSTLAPLAHVFDNYDQDQRRYRNHTVPNVLGSTARATLEPVIKDFFTTNKDESTLLVFTGLGSSPTSSADQVALKLWDDTTLSVTQLGNLLGQHSKPLRFIFSQCYSGGFHRLAFANTQHGNTLDASPRCGFTAESAYRNSESCSALPEDRKYRDYASYFFAALSGAEHNGEILGIDPDLDQNGQISLREAHFYTLEKALSIDLSRSTSEAFLSRWEPWYLKWVPSPHQLPSNEYSRLFRNIAQQYKVELVGGVARQLRSRLSVHDKKLALFTQQLIDNRAQRLMLQSRLQIAASNRWPALSSPYTTAFQSMSAAGELNKVALWLSEQPDYPTLLAAQQVKAQLNKDIAEVRRTANQMLKLLRLRHLARLKDQLYHYGSPADIQSYESLVACESLPLVFDDSGNALAAAKG